MAVLDPGGSGWHVSGRNSGIVQIVFCEDHSTGKSGEYFGLMDIRGKGASFLGTTVISLISQVTGHINIGVGSISLFFVIGMIMFRMAAAEK